MTRVALYLPFPKGMTGAPRRTIALAEALRRQHLHVGIFGNPQTPFVQEAGKRGFEIVRFEDTRDLEVPYSSVRSFSALQLVKYFGSIARNNIEFARRARAWKADKIWIRSLRGFAFSGLGARLAGCPVTLDLDYEPAGHGLTAALSFLSLSLSRQVVLQYGAAAREIFGSRLTRTFDKRLYPLIPGIEIETIEKRAVPSSTRSDEKVVIVQVGSISQRKNQLFSLEVFSEAVSNIKGVEAEIHFIGDIHDLPYKEKMLLFARDQKIESHVRFLGWRENSLSLVVNSDVLLMPSYNEGVPNAVQEAMLLGVPVVASTAGGLPEILDNGRTGWSVDLSEKDVWAQVLQKLIEDAALRSAVGAAATAFARDHFSMDEWGVRYSAFFKGS